MNDMQTRGAVMSNSNAYSDNLAHRQHDAYGGSDPYAKKDPYANNDAHKKGEEKEKKGLWELDFSIVRFFRENYNAGIDFEESPRVFFDEEYMLSLRLKLLGRNFTTMLLKFFLMLFFTTVTLFLNFRGVMLVSFLYLAMFVYYILVPMAFMKYIRQYIADDTEKGKLKKIYQTYAKWMRPLETITMNSFTIIFVALEIILFLNTELVLFYMNKLIEKTNFNALINYVSTLNLEQVQSSILMVMGIYLFSYLVYWVFIYKIWSPKWEKKRKENELLWSRTNQRTAKNLKDALTVEV